MANELSAHWCYWSLTSTLFSASANIRYIHNVPVRMRRPYLSEGIVDLNMPEFPAIPEDTVEVLTKYLMSLKTDPPALVEEATVAKLPVLAKEPVVIQETVVTDEPGVKDLESESVWVSVYNVTLTDCWWENLLV